MTATQEERGKAFRALHHAPGTFVIANVWDGGSARMMASLGFAALATSSGAHAGTFGRRDGKVTRDEAMAEGYRRFGRVPFLVKRVDLGEKPRPLVGVVL